MPTFPMSNQRGRGGPTSKRSKRQTSNLTSSFALKKLQHQQQRQETSISNNKRNWTRSLQDPHTGNQYELEDWDRGIGTGNSRAIKSGGDSEEEHTFEFGGGVLVNSADDFEVKGTGAVKKGSKGGQQSNYQTANPSFRNQQQNSRTDLHQSGQAIWRQHPPAPTNHHRQSQTARAATSPQRQSTFAPAARREHPSHRNWKFEVLDETWLRKYFYTVAPTVAAEICGKDVLAADLERLIQLAGKDLAHLLGRKVGDTFEDVKRWLATTFLRYLGGSQSPAIATGEDIEIEDARLSISTMAPNVVTTALIGQFLTQINGFVSVQNETQLADYLMLEPPFSDHYTNMIAELKQVFPVGKEDELEQKCTQALVAARNGVDGSASWTPFITFMAQYLAYLRDVDTAGNASSYLDAYNLLIGLQEKANSALNHGTLGHLMLQTVVRCAKLVSRLAIGLDRQPGLIAHLKSSKPGGADNETRETLPERAADILRRAFTTCLNDRTSITGPDGRPTGKKRGIYTIANICLKILFQCRKTRNATMIFENIGNQSPPLSQYPKSERVTYLYYLGRYLFQNGHFYRAQLALEYAYDECPANSHCIKQRRFILVYLTTCNLILGRFPSSSLLQRPEATNFQTYFGPLMLAIKTGNLALFRQHLDYTSPHVPWFLHFRILLPLRNRCEVHVWRSLIRRTWNIAGTKPDPSKATAPYIDIHHLVTAFSWMERQSSTAPCAIDPDFDGSTYYNSLPSEPSITSTTIESILSSLIDQGFLRGFIAHQAQKFAISKTKSYGGDAAAAGFPAPWSVIKQRGDGEVPGWRKKEQFGGGGLGAPGMVVNLSGVRGVGA